MTDRPDSLHPLLEGLGDRVKERRKAIGLSVNELGRRSGTDGGRVSRIENGERLGKLSINVVAALAHALECRMGWLATGEMPIEPIPVDAENAVVIAVQDGVGADYARQLREMASALELLQAPATHRRRRKNN